MKPKLFVITVLMLFCAGLIGVRLLRLPRVEFVAGLWPG